MKNAGRWLGGGAIGAVAGGVLSIAIQVVSHFEGTELTAYADPVGIPTICTGHTGPEVRLNQTRTQEECDALLAGDLGIAFDAIERHVNDDIERNLPPARRAALASFVFNVGEGAFKRSTLLKKLNAGNTRGACNELTRWVYAGGKKLTGLERRRAAERELCLQGLEQ